MAYKWFTGAGKWLDLIDQQIPGFEVRTQADMRAAMGHLWAVSQNDEAPVTMDTHEIAFCVGMTTSNVRHAERTSLMALRAAFGMETEQTCVSHETMSGFLRARRIVRAYRAVHETAYAITRGVHDDRHKSVAHAFPMEGRERETVAICGREYKCVEPRESWLFNHEPDCKMCAAALRAAGAFEGDDE